MPKQQFSTLEGNTLLWSDTGRKRGAGLVSVSEERRVALRDVAVVIKGRAFCFRKLST